MKKENIINLIKYHVENNNIAFINETCKIAKDFEALGDEDIAGYLYDLISSSNVYIPQTYNEDFNYLAEIKYSSKPLYLPNIIEEDVIGITKAVRKKTGMYKFLFYGSPGTGKTESAYQVARILNYKIYMVNIEQLIDSKLGESSKNVVNMFKEINKLPSNSSVVIFDELDALVSNRMNNNDLKEMARVTTTFLKQFDDLKKEVVIIATTNLINSFDKALKRRFDALISFDRYSKNDLLDISTKFLIREIKKSVNLKQDIKLFKKIIINTKYLYSPGEIKQLIKTAVAFSDDEQEYDYLRKLYLLVNQADGPEDIQTLSKKGYTSREIEVLTKIPKSSVNRRISRGKNE